MSIILKETKMDSFFIHHIKRIIDLEQEMMAHVKDVETLKVLKRNGFSDSYIAKNWNMSEKEMCIRDRYGFDRRIRKWVAGYDCQ